MRGFPGGSEGEEPACKAGDLSQSLGWEYHVEEPVATHSSVLAWRIPWTEEPGGYSLWGHKESDAAERLSPPPPDSCEGWLSSALQGQSFDPHPPGASEQRQTDAPQSLAERGKGCFLRPIVYINNNRTEQILPSHPKEIKWFPQPIEVACNLIYLESLSVSSMRTFILERGVH